MLAPKSTQSEEPRYIYLPLQMAYFIIIIFNQQLPIQQLWGSTQSPNVIIMRQQQKQTQISFQKIN